MGTGLHGVNGLSPAVSLHIIKIYAIPRLLYGLDATVLSRKQRDELNGYYRNLLRMIQGLPTSTAKEAIFLLLGELPLEAELDIRILSLFGAICRVESNSTLKEIAQRQLALENKLSWSNQASNLCQKYKISCHLALEAPWRKKTWNEYITTAIKGYWLQKLLEGMGQKRSLLLLDTSNALEFKPHNIWTSCMSDPRLVTAASTRAKIITGTYWVQKKRAKLNVNNADPTCLLCKESAEDVRHMVIDCKATVSSRANKLQKIRNSGFPVENIKELINGPLEEDSHSAFINRLISELCHGVHSERSKKLQQMFSSISST
jgi:hypothetical protein